MKIVDLRSQLPVVTANLPWPSTSTKDSNTVHWTGGSDTVTTDAQAIAAIKRWHQEHINKDWGNGQRGAGIMYLEVIAPSGTVFLTRDSDAVTWHCSDSYGNAHSRPILVICDQDDLPTQAQLESLEQRLTFPNVYPHQYWVGTQCPGPQLLAYLAEREEDDMDRPTFDAWFREQLVAEITPTLVAMKDAYDPLVAAARANGELDASQDLAMTELKARIDKLKTI